MVLAQIRSLLKDPEVVQGYEPAQSKQGGVEVVGCCHIQMSEWSESVDPCPEFWVVCS